jgi:hypothetical protein
MFSEFDRLMRLYHYYGISNTTIWDYVIYLIQLFITLYVAKIYLEHLISSQQRFMNLQAVMVAILIIGISFKYPDNFINMDIILYYIKSSNLIAFLVGIVLSFIILISTEKHRSELLSQVLLIVATILLLPTIEGAIIWSSEMAYISTLGKVCGVLIFHHYRKVLG